MDEAGEPAQRHTQRTADLYDAALDDWPGELDFYQALAAEATGRGQLILEVGCGTGRVAIRLAQAGNRVVGLDLSVPMLTVARRKSKPSLTVHWWEGDMRSFELSERFGLAIIPGHSFQHMLTAHDQIACLRCIRRHLLPGGKLVVHLDHQDIDWLGDLSRGQGTGFEPAGEFVDPQTGHRIRQHHAWGYARATQRAVVTTRWEELDASGDRVDEWEIGPLQLHCVFPTEMEHALARAGYTVEAVYGDFARGPLDETSSEMIWVAQAGAAGL